MEYRYVAADLSGAEVEDKGKFSQIHVRDTEEMRHKVFPAIYYYLSLCGAKQQ